MAVVAVNAASTQNLLTHSLGIGVEHVEVLDVLLVHGDAFAVLGLAANPVGVRDDVLHMVRIVALLKAANLKRHMVNLHYLAQQVVVDVQGKTAVT